MNDFKEMRESVNNFTLYALHYFEPWIAELASNPSTGENDMVQKTIELDQ